MTEYLRTIPGPDADSAPFWEACRQHELHIQRCASCGALRFPPTAACPQCWSQETAWVRAAGRGKVFSWIVVTHPVPKDVFANEVPYVVALVELDEGVRLATNIIGCDPHSVEADMPVEVIFDDVTPEVTLPKFRPLR